MKRTKTSQRFRMIKARALYFKALEQLSHYSRVWTNSAEDHALLQVLCPHVSVHKVLAALESGSYVACPGLHVRGQYQVINLIKAWEDHNGKHPSRLQTGFSNHIVNESYAFAKEAIRYSNSAWGPLLLSRKKFRRNRGCAISITLDDPSVLTRNGYPTYRGTLYVFLNKDLNRIYNDSNETGPYFRRYDKHIIAMTTSSLIFHEMSGHDLGVYQHYACAYCGDGISLTGCYCGFTFEDNQMGCSNECLSPRMVSFLVSQGHVFKKDPKFAWVREDGVYAGHLVQAESREQKMREYELSVVDDTKAKKDLLMGMGFEEYEPNPLNPTPLLVHLKRKVEGGTIFVSFSLMGTAFFLPDGSINGVPWCSGVTLDTMMDTINNNWRKLPSSLFLPKEHQSEGSNAN